MSLTLPALTGISISGSMQRTVSGSSLQGGSAGRVQTTVNSGRIQGSRARVSAPGVRLQPAGRVVATISVRPTAPKVMPSADMSKFNLSFKNVKAQSYVTPQIHNYPGSHVQFDYLSAASSAYDYADVGAKVGAGVGCVVGAVAISFVLTPWSAWVGCFEGAEIGAVAGGVIVGGAGYIQGGYHMKYENSLAH